MISLAELSPLDTVAGTRKLLRASSANDPAVTGLNDVIWRPAITEEAEIGIRLFKGDFDGQAAPSTGSLSIQIDQWLSIEPNARRFLWQGAPVKLYAGVSGQAWPWAVVFEGLVDQFSAGANTVKLNLKVNTEPFDADVLTLKYAGTGGAEGDANLKDKVKPFLLGRCFNVEPVLINSVDNVLQFSGYGPIQAVMALFERGSAFGASQGDYPTYAALVAATIAPGQWATCLAQGMVRLGAPPYGVITGDVDGDKAGGTWRRKTGEIIQRIASNSGVSGSLIESASFTALDTALAGLSNQGRIGVFIDSQISVLDIAAKLAAPCNAQVGVSLAGKMFVGRVAIGSPTITLDAQQRQLPRVISSSEVSVSPPFSYIEMGYARSERVHTDQEIAGIDTLLNVRFPSPPPAVMLKGGSYFDATNKQYIYDDPVVRIGDVPVTIGEVLVTTSGYADVQDLAISQALADAAAADAAAAAAQNVANAADANAAVALNRLSEIASDGILTPDEKPRVLMDRDVIVAEQGGIDAQAAAFSITTERTAYNTSVAALTSYLATLTTPALWSDLSGNTNIAGASFRNAFVAVYAARQTLLNKIADVAKARADLAVTNAAAAQAAANAAQAAANAANAAIAQIDDDNVITISEKVEVLIPGAAAFQALYNAVVANANAASVSITTLNTRRTAWLAALSAISPAWNNISAASPVVRGSLDTARSQYDSELKEVQRLAIEAMTAARQVVIVPPLPQTVYRTWLGAIKDSQYPRTLTPKVERGGVDIRTSNDVSYAISTMGSITATVNNTDGSADKGRITATGGSSGSILLTITVSGVAQPVFTIPFNNEDDNPPTTGGGGNIGGSDSTLEDVTSTSFVAITQQDAGESVFLIDITSGQTINGTAPLSYRKGGTSTASTAMVARWQYRLQGSTPWLDFVAGPTNVTGSSAYWNSTDFEDVQGDITANQSKSGLATGTYECQLIAAKSNSVAGNLQIVSGAATVSKS